MMKDSVYVGQVNNYNYGAHSLTNSKAERELWNLEDQTVSHPQYTRNGPWIPASSLDFYTQQYSIETNHASVDCSAIRQHGDGQKGFFDVKPGSTVTLKMGYRVYDNAEATRARIHRDYDDVSFELLSE